MVGGVSGRGKSVGLSPQTVFRLRGLLPVPIVFVMFAWANPTATSLLVGVAVVIIGELIRLWAAGFIRKYRVSEVQADELVTAGPYAFVRNPLYWGNFLIGLGIAVISNWWISYLLFIAMYLYLYSAIIPLEESHLQTLFGDQYEEYQKHVPRLWPRFVPHPGGHGSFSLKVAMTGEALTILMHGVVVLFFALKYYYG